MAFRKTYNDSLIGPRNSFLFYFEQIDSTLNINLRFDRYISPPNRYRYFHSNFPRAATFNSKPHSSPPPFVLIAHNCGTNYTATTTIAATRHVGLRLETSHYATARHAPAFPASPPAFSLPPATVNPVSCRRGQFHRVFPFLFRLDYMMEKSRDFSR